MTTSFKLPTSVISNGQGASAWADPNNVLLVDDRYAVSSGIANVLEVGNFNLNIPQGSNVTNFTVQVKGYRGSFNTTLQIYAVDDTSGTALSYPLAPFQGFSGSNTLYTLPSSLFGTTWTVDQANNIKLRLISDAELHLDAVLVNADFVPVVAPVPVPPSSGLVVVDEFVEAIRFSLAQSITATDLFVFLQTFDLPDGTPIQYADFHGEADLVIDQGVPGYEEQVVITDVEHDYQGTGLVRLSFGSIDNRGLKFVYPYDHDIDLCRPHDGTAECVISNSARFYSRFLRKNQIGALVSGPVEVDSNDTLVAYPVTKFNFKGAGQTTTVNGANAKEVEVVIPGYGGTTPPVVVSAISGTSGSVQVSALSANLPISGLNRGTVIEISTEQLQTVASVTVGGVAATQEIQATDSPSNLRSEIWVCVNPPIGVQPVVVTLSGPAYLTFGAECVTGIDTSSATGTVASAGGTSDAPTLSLTTARDYSLVFDGLATAMTPILYTPGPGQSENWHQTANAAARQGGSSFQSAGLEPDAVTMQYSITQNTKWVYTAVEIKGITNAVPPSAGVSRIIAGTNVTITSTGPSGTGDVTVSATGSGGGIASINGDATAAQVIAAGSGISVSSSGGTTIIANTAGGNSGPGAFALDSLSYTSVSGGGGTYQLAYEPVSNTLYTASYGGGGGAQNILITRYLNDATSGLWYNANQVVVSTLASTPFGLTVDASKVRLFGNTGAGNMTTFNLDLSGLSTTTITVPGFVGIIAGSGLYSDGTDLWFMSTSSQLTRHNIAGNTNTNYSCSGFNASNVKSIIVDIANSKMYSMALGIVLRTMAISGSTVTQTASRTMVYTPGLQSSSFVFGAVPLAYAAPSTKLSAIYSYPIGFVDSNGSSTVESATQFAQFLTLDQA